MDFFRFLFSSVFKWLEERSNLFVVVFSMFATKLLCARSLNIRNYNLFIYLRLLPLNMCKTLKSLKRRFCKQVHTCAHNAVVCANIKNYLVYDKSFFAYSRRGRRSLASHLAQKRQSIKKDSVDLIKKNEKKRYVLLSIHS